MIQFPRYRLDTDLTFPQVGLQIRQAEMDIQMRPSPAERSLNPTAFTVIPRQVEFSIDYRELETYLDDEPPVRFTEKYVGEGSALLEQETSWRAHNGDLYYRATPGDLRPMLDFAMRYFHSQDEHAANWNIALAPQHRPQAIFKVEPSQRLQFPPLITEAYSLQITASMPQANAYLAVKPEIKMRATRLDQRV